MRPFLLLQRHKREPWAEPPTGGRCWECDSSHSVSAVPTSEPHEKAPESVLKVRESCKSLPLTPQGCTLSPWAGTCLDRTYMAEKESLGQPAPPLFGEADGAGPPEVKPASQKVAGLDLSFLRSAQLGCSPCSRRRRGRLRENAEWG